MEYTTIQQIWSDCVTVLSTLAQIGHEQPDTQVYALRSGLFRLPKASEQTIPNELRDTNFHGFGESLNRLELATPKLKKAVVDACSHTVMVDGTVTVEEAELLRALVIALDCPLPPFLNAAVR